MRPKPSGSPGVTYRQLDYWTRTGLVTPSIKDAHGSGSQRLYSFQDLATLRVIKRLLDTGRLAPARAQGRGAPAHHGARPHGVTLMSDGAGVYEAHSPEAVVDLLKNGQGVFAISLDAVWSDLETDVDARRQAPGPAGRDRRLVSAQPRRRPQPSQSDTVRFAHASERQFAQLLDFYAIAWEYEPRSFDIEWDREGQA